MPEHLLVIGGGYIGLEFGQLFRRFGSRVTIIQQAAQLLRGEDADIAAEVLKIMHEDGVDVLLNAKVRSASPRKARKLSSPSFVVKTPVAKSKLSPDLICSSLPAACPTQTL